MDVFQIKFTNQTDKEISASLFHLFQDNIGLKVESNYLQNLKNWLSINKFECNLIRVQFFNNIEEQKSNLYFRPFYYTEYEYKHPLFLVGECISPFQFQSGIIDVPVDIEFDGFSNDLTFDIYPNEGFFITLFSKSENKKINKNDLTPFSGLPFVVENTSDENLVIDLFKEEDYRKLVEDKKGLIYNSYLGRKSFGQIGIVDEKEDYLFLKPKRGYYDCVRIVNPSESELNDIIVNGKLIKLKNNLYIKNENDIHINQNKIAVDLKLEEKNDFNSFIVTVPPKTNMMFSFGIYDKIEATPMNQKLYLLSLKETISSINFSSRMYKK